jgi:hypothetical protein
MCPGCGEIFCVDELRGESVVWHGICGRACKPVLPDVEVAELTSAIVEYDRKWDRLEIRNRG